MKTLIAGWEPDDHSDVWGTDADPITLSVLAWERLDLGLKLKVRHAHVYDLGLSRQCIKSVDTGPCLAVRRP